MVEEIEVGKNVTPIKKASKFQVEKKAKKVVDENNPRFKKYDVVLNGRELQIKYDSGTQQIVIDGQIYEPRITEMNGYFIVNMGDHSYRIEHHDGQIFLEGRLVEFNFQASVPKLARNKMAGDNQELIKAPLPGQVVGIHVKRGSLVENGQTIITLEAMKMQNEISSRIVGRVKEIYVREGDQVGSDDRLVLIVKE